MNRLKLLYSLMKKTAMKNVIMVFFFILTLQAHASKPSSCAAVEKLSGNAQQIEAQKAEHEAKVRDRMKLPTTSKQLVTLPSKQQNIIQQQRKLNKIYLEQALQAPLSPETQRMNDLIAMQYLMALKYEDDNKWDCVIL